MGGEFKWRHFAGEVILLCVRWYCRYGISYRDLEEMMGERGVAVDHTTLYRWVQRYAPELEKRALWYQKPDQLLVAGRRDLHPRQGPVEIPVPGNRQRWRDAKAAKRFLAKALRRSRDWTPQVINTDKNSAYGEAIAELKKEGLLPKDTRHRQVKYLNNRLEGDHGKLKRLIKPTLGFQSMKTAYATIKGDADVQERSVQAVDRGGGQRNRGILRQPAVRRLRLKTRSTSGRHLHDLCNGAPWRCRRR